MPSSLFDVPSRPPVEVACAVYRIFSGFIGSPCDGKSADGFCDVVELRAEREPARLELLDLAADRLQAPAVLGALLGIERVAGARRLERVALREQHAKLVVDLVQL